MVLLSVLVFGCTGPVVKESAEVKRAPLNIWMEQLATDKIITALRTNSFIKDRPFIIVKARGEVVSAGIDDLTSEIREQLVSVLLEYPEIRLVRRHPAPVIERTYTLQELKCGRYTDPKILITIDIKPISEQGARINIRAIDRKERDAWVRGFSIHNQAQLTPNQMKQLKGPEKPDEYLRGLKYVPFAESQRDEMAAFLARNLSCIFQEGYIGSDISVYVDSSRVKRRSSDIVWFLAKHLQSYNEIQLVSSMEKADFILTAEEKTTGPDTNLSQFWIGVEKKGGDELVKGLATYAYYISSPPDRGAISGKWTIHKLPSKKKIGDFEISGNSQKGYQADFVRSDSSHSIKRGIIIRLDGKHVDWTYYDKWAQKTFEVEGILQEDGYKMTVTVSTFPSAGKPEKWELERVE